MQSFLYPYLAVGIGGAVGAIARFGLNNWLQRGTEIPWGTLAANLTGCFVMGIIAQLFTSVSWATDTGVVSEHYRLLFAVGFCGSFTTLSAMVLEISGMMQRNEVFYSFAYLVGTLIGGFACFYLGVVVVRAVLQTQAAS